MTGTPLFFLHLSDIHFHKPLGGEVFDLDRRLREELINDAEGRFRSLNATPSAVLIGGDITFKGASALYDKAWYWLEQDLCVRLKCPTEDICCVPGNHDVNRSVLDKRPIADCYRNLRSVDTRNIDGLIQEYLPFSDFFYEKLAEYNRFALKFECDITVQQPFWDRAFTLNDGSTLQFRGMNSTLVSDANDHVDTGKMIVGQYQCSLARRDGTEYVVICHHPPQWLRDADEVEGALNPVVPIQLFGHKHKRQVLEVDGVLRLMAGALHPDRNEPDWQPAYNIFSVRVVGDKERALEVDVHPRLWSPRSQQFIADYETCGGAEHRTYTIRIKEWLNRADVRESGTPKDVVSAESAPGLAGDRMEPLVAVDGRNMDPNRTLAHRFLSLAFVDRMQIAQELGLLSNEDEGMPESGVFKAFFQRAKARGLLADLWDRVESLHADSRFSTNPFRTSS